MSLDNYPVSEESYQNNLNNQTYGHDQAHSMLHESGLVPVPTLPPDVVHSPQTAQPLQTPSDMAFKKKSLIDAYILGLPPVGWFGAHHFYLKRTGWGVLYICTFGLFCLGWLFDLIRMPLLVKRTNKIRTGEVSFFEKYLPDAYLCWFPPLGIFGKLLQYVKCRSHDFNICPT